MEGCFRVREIPVNPSLIHLRKITEMHALRSRFINAAYQIAVYVLYANIDNFDATKYALDFEKLSVMDKWLLSRLSVLSMLHTRLR